VPRRDKQLRASIGEAAVTSDSGLLNSALAVSTGVCACEEDVLVRELLVRVALDVSSGLQAVMEREQFGSIRMERPL
jgi:hypothetical protein